MPRPSLVILGYSEAAMYLRHDASRVSAIISIHGAREFGVEADGVPRLDLRFDDVDVPAINDIDAIAHAAARQQWLAKNGLTQTPPTRDDVAAIIAFANVRRTHGGKLLCHCAGGISRAPAAALVCLAAWTEAGCEQQLVDEIRRLRPGAVPHAGIIQFADELLKREGRLHDAVKVLRLSDRP